MVSVNYVSGEWLIYNCKENIQLNNRKSKELILGKTIQLEQENWPCSLLPAAPSWGSARELALLQMMRENWQADQAQNQVCELAHPTSTFSMK